MRIDNKNASKILSDESTVEQLARMEHARWNIEKLIVGFYALPSDERERLRGKNDSITKERDSLKEKEYKHYCIATYDELEEDKKKNDRTIVRHMIDIIE